MADMDTKILLNTDEEYISVTLCPEGHLCTDDELMQMVRAAIASVEAGEGTDIDPNY